MTKYDELLDRNKYDAILDAPQTQLRTAVRGALDRDPDQAANVVSLSERTGLPAPIVERNRELVERQDELSRYDALLERSPEVARFLSEPDNAAVARDDVSSLSGLEWATRAFGQAHREQWKTIELGTLRARQLGRDLTPEENARVTQLKSEITGSDFGAEDWYEKVVVETGRLLPTIEHSTVAGVRTGLVTGLGAAGVTAIAGQAGPQVAVPEEIITVPSAASIGFKLGAAAGAAKAAYDLEAGLALDEFLDIRDETGQPLDVGIARGAASMVGAVNAGLESLGLAAILKRIPGVKHLVPSMGRVAVKEALQRATFRQAVKTFAAGYAMSVGTEVTTEVLQEATTILGGQIAGQLSSENFKGLTSQQIADRLADIAIKTTQGMALIGGAGPGAQFVADAQRAQQAERNQAVFEALGQHASDSKLRQRLPERFQAYVARLREGGEVQDVRIPVEEFATYFQTQGLDPAEVAREVTGSDAAYTEAQAAGTDLVIPLEAYATRLAPTDHHAKLMPNLRLRADEMTAREAEQWRAQAESLTQELSGMAAGTAPPSAVYDDVLGQLLASGIERGAAEQNAQLMSSVFETLGARTGTDPMALYERYGLRVRQEVPAVLQSVGNLDTKLDPLIDRLRAGKTPTDREVYGPSLVEFLLEKGGLQDQGGELAARDAQKSIRGLVKKTGRTFDEATELAAEAGYLAQGSTERELLEAIDRELSGERVHRPNALNQQLLDLRQALDDLGDYLGQQGVDLAQADNAAVRNLLQSATTLDQPAYHGGPHLFEKFSLEKIGTGEGAQSFGWGLYFAENKAVAEQYQRQLASDSRHARFIVNGKELDNESPERHGASLLAFNDTREIRSTTKRWLTELDGNLGMEDTAKNAGLSAQEYWTRLNDFVQSHGKRDIKVERGALYEVDIPDGVIGKMLDWDKLSTEQAPAVKEALKTAGVLKRFKENLSDFSSPQDTRGKGRGENLYAFLSHEKGSDEAASKYLASIGIPGIKYLDEGSRDKKRGTRNLVVFDDSVVEIKTVNGRPLTAGEKKELFQKFEETRRGSIEFGAARKFTINLLKNRDLSTFLHESGHLYLEVLGDLAEADGAPAQIVQDYAAILKWLGVESRQAIKVEHHEKFARGFEAYLFEGKAPSVELQNAFARFRAWLVSIYRKLSALNVEMTKEVRGVFDRLVATDDAIAGAEEAQNYVPIFTTAEAAGMTPQQFAAYRKTVQDARLQAEDDLSRKLLAVMTREQKQWWKDRRKEVSAGVTAEVHGMRVYRALSFLRFGTNPDGTAVEGVATVKLDKAALTDEFRYPMEFLKRLPGAGKSKVYAAEGGVHPDIVAAMFGYRGTSELVTDLVNARPMKELIEAETDAKMRELYPDPLVDGSLADEAIQVVHSGKRGELLAAELRALKRKAREVGPFVRAAQQKDRQQRQQALEANRGQMPDRDEYRLIRAAAERTVNGKRMRDVSPATYRVAEAKASRAAFAAAAKGDFQTAYFEKRKQLLNHELYRAAEQAVEDSESIRDYFKSFAKKSKRERIGKANDGSLEKIEALLASIDLGRISNKAVDRRVTLEGIRQQIANGDLMADPETIKRLEAAVRNWRELSYDELVGLQDVVKQLEHQAAELSEALVNGERVKIKESAEAVAASVMAGNKSVGFLLGTPRMADKARRSVRQSLYSWLRPAELARQLDGGQDFGATLRTIIEPIRRAYAEKLIPAEKKVREDVAGLYRAAYTNEELSALNVRGAMPEIDANATKGDLLSLALNWGNAGNRQALLDSTLPGGRKPFTEERIAQALGRLTAKDWTFVQSVWDYIDTYWAQLSATEKRRRGVAPRKVEATSFTVTTADGQRIEVKGGYYPLKYDPLLSSQQRADQAEQDFSKFVSVGNLATSTRAGSTIERVGSGGRPVRLGLGVIDQHLSEVARDLSIGDEVRFVYRILQRPEIKGAMAETGNEDALDTLKMWLKDAAVGEMAAHDFPSQAAAWARIGFTKAKLAWNVTTTLLQVTGLPQTMVVVGPKAFAHGVKRYLGSPVRAHREIMSESAFMRARYQENAWNKDVQDTKVYLGSFFGPVPTKLKRAVNALSYSYFWPIAKVQMVVDGITWTAGYWKGVHEKGLAPNSKDAIAYADSMVENAQTSGFFVDRSAIERGSLSINQRQSQFVKLWTTLISYMLAKGNIAYAKGRQFGRAPSLWSATTLAGDVVALYAIEAILAGAIRGTLPDDDDDSWLGFIAKESAASAIGGFPVLREVMAGFYGSGNTPIGGLAKDFSNALTQTAQGEADIALFKAWNNLGGTLFHYPAGQTNRVVEAMWADADGEDVAAYEYLTGPRKDE